MAMVGIARSPCPARASPRTAACSVAQVIPRGVARSRGRHTGNRRQPRRAMRAPTDYPGRALLLRRPPRTKEIPGWGIRSGPGTTRVLRTLPGTRSAPNPGFPRSTPACPQSPAPSPPLGEGAVGIGDGAGSEHRDQAGSRNVSPSRSSCRESIRSSSDLRTWSARCLPLSSLIAPAATNRAWSSLNAFRTTE